MRKLALIFGCLVALAGQAMAQSFPQTLPPSTVYGRLGISAGPGQAIPFATLGAQLSGTETTVNDANYALVAADRTIAYTALTAARTVTLLAASAYPAGTKLYFLDRSGNANATKTISLAPTGADTINGANTTLATVNAPYAMFAAETDGISKWAVSVALFAASSPTLTGNWTFSPASGTAITIAPSSGTLTTGLLVNQFPSGTTATNCSGASVVSCFNQINVGTSTTPENVNLTTLNAATSALSVLHVYGGSAMHGNRVTLNCASVLNAASGNTTSSDYVCGTFSVVANANDGGTVGGIANGRGGLFALNPQFQLGTSSAGANATFFTGAVGGEVNGAVQTGSSAYIVGLWNLVWRSDHRVAGLTYDFQLGLSSQSDGSTVRGANGILFHDGNGQLGVAASGKLLGVQLSNPFTVDRGISLTNANLTITTSAFACCGDAFLVDGSGNTRTPFVVGGLVASSTLTLESTSGVGTTDSIIFKTGSQVTRFTIDTVGSLISVNKAAPSSPSAGNVSIWTDSTDLRLHDKNASGAIGTTVVADTGTANNFLTAISAAGVISKARPTCANLSDSSTGCTTTVGTIATQSAASVAITGGTIVGLTGLAIRDTSAAFDVTIAATSSGALSAGRTLTLNMGNVAHTLALGTTANTITFPNTASDTVAMLGTTNAFTGVNTFSNLVVQVTGGVLTVNNTSAGTNTYVNVVNSATTNDASFRYDNGSVQAFWGYVPSGGCPASVICGFIGAQIVNVDTLGFKIVVATDATSTSTGALRVLGGASINKRVWMDGLSAASGTPSSICRNANEVTVNAAVTCTVSSLIFKHDFKQLDQPALPVVMGMKPGSFFYNDDGTRQRMGFAAEYMFALDRRLADGFDTGGHPRSIDQNAILAVMVKAVQELKNDNDNIRHELELVKRKVAK